MSGGVEVDIAVEGYLDEIVLTKLLGSIGIQVLGTHGRRGKGHLRKRIQSYNQAARHGRWVVLVDLNNDAECAPPFVASWLPSRNPNLQFRVAVRAIEAWLLADREAIADFLAVSEARIPMQPENEPNPKATLVEVARRSRRRTLRRDIVPRPRSAARQGPGYTSRLIQFATGYWDPGRAARHAPSLKRGLDSLSRCGTSGDD
jgi:hypothetical protein